MSIDIQFRFIDIQFEFLNTNIITEKIERQNIIVTRCMTNYSDDNKYSATAKE